MTKTTILERMDADLARAMKAGWVFAVADDSDEPHVREVAHHNEDGDEVVSRLTAKTYRGAEIRCDYNRNDPDAVLATALNRARKVKTY